MTDPPLRRAMEDHQGRRIQLPYKHVLSFQNNLPMVGDYEHFGFLTANHGHAALIGVFGMLGIAPALYAVRNVAKEVWGPNVGLSGVVILTLTPSGLIQLNHIVERGFWSSRSLQFYQRSIVNTLLWLRILPDTIFIVLGVVPLVLGFLKGFFNMCPVTPIGEPVQEKVRRLAPPLKLPVNRYAAEMPVPRCFSLTCRLAEARAPPRLTRSSGRECGGGIP